MPDEIEDLLKTLYESNDHYQNVKERVVWLAGVVYLTFSVALLAWYLGPENRNVLFSIQGLEKWHVAVFLFVIFVLVAAFIFRQTWHKVRAAAITGQFNALIKELRCADKRTYKSLMDANCYNKKKSKSIWDFISMGWSGHLIFGVVYSFFLTQMVALFGVCYWKTTFLPGRWILLPALPYILPLLAIVLPLLTFLWNKVVLPLLTFLWNKIK